MRIVVAGLMLLAGLSLGSGAAFATTAVFKCAKPDGSVIFSPTPCGTNAKEVDTSRSQLRGTSPNVEGVGDRAALSRIDGDCDGRDRAISESYAGQYAAADREIARLKIEMTASMNNYAGATRDNGIRGQLSAAEDRRSSLSTSERNEHSALRKECEETRRSEIKRQADRDAAKSSTNPGS